MAQIAPPPLEPSPASPVHNRPGFLRKLFGRGNGTAAPPADLPRGSEPEPDPDPDPETDLDPSSETPDVMRRISRKVVPGVPRAQTFKRQQSEKRNNLAPVQPTPDERRAVSVDRRAQQSRALSQPATQGQPFPRASAPGLLDQALEIRSAPSAQTSPIDEKLEYALAGMADPVRPDSISHDPQRHDDLTDTHSITTSRYDQMIHEELERTWILNLSMHFRDKSKREKFFVTYRESSSTWRRVTISLDYRNAPDNSLEMDLAATKFQRDKSARIYEAIRESLQDIQFYDTVTNLKLQTTDGRLHVHVVEDTNEIIPYPSVRQVQHLGCHRIRESEISFDSHMSGFVYKVQVGGETLIKKEIPGPDTVEEFLYEINALNRLGYSEDVIRFYGIVVDDRDEFVKGLLISYADQGALIDVLYDNRRDSEAGTPWFVRERWARQIVQGLSDIHESGFVQGDFTLSNIVIDDFGDAKIIDINRRGCPVGWEPPEATPLIEGGQRISMYIGVKSDLYQLGMVLWALATQEDEPEAHGRPLILEPDVVPEWYREMVAICLSDEPRLRRQAASLLPLFPSRAVADDTNQPGATAISVQEGQSVQEYLVDDYVAEGHPRIRTVQPTNEWTSMNLGHVADPHYYTRGRSPPSPLPSHLGQLDSFQKGQNLAGWAGARDIAPSYSDVGADEVNEARKTKSVTPRTSKESFAAPVPVADAYPVVFIDKLGATGEQSADPMGALTPESLAVEHHIYGRNRAATAITPTPERIEAWALEASEAGPEPEHEQEQAQAPGLDKEEAPDEVPASVPLPVSPPKEDEVVPPQEPQYLFSQPVLEPVPDDLPKLDEAERTVEPVELPDDPPIEPVDLVNEPVDTTAVDVDGEQLEEDATGKTQDLSSEPAPEPESGELSQLNEASQAVETVEPAGDAATEAAKMTPQDSEDVTQPTLAEAQESTGTETAGVEEAGASSEPMEAPRDMITDPVNVAAADSEEAKEPALVEPQENTGAETAGVEEAGASSEPMEAPRDMSTGPVNVAAADSEEAKAPMTLETQESTETQPTDAGEASRSFEVVESTEMVNVATTDWEETQTKTLETQEKMENDTVGAVDSRGDTAIAATATEWTWEEAAQAEDEKEAKDEQLGISEAGLTVPEGQIENSTEETANRETDTSAAPELSVVNPGEEAQENISITEEAKLDPSPADSAQGEALEPWEPPAVESDCPADTATEAQAGKGGSTTEHSGLKGAGAAHLDTDGTMPMEASLDDGAVSSHPVTRGLDSTDSTLDVATATAPMSESNSIPAPTPVPTPTPTPSSVSVSVSVSFPGADPTSASAASAINTTTGEGTTDMATMTT